MNNDRGGEPRMNHAELRKTWRPGQRWETRVLGQPRWVPVSDGGLAEPLWDEWQEYRQVQEGQHP